MVRILFFFRREDGNDLPLNIRFFSLSVLFKRLLHEKYPECSLKYVNILFYEEELYIKYPLFKRQYVHKFGNNLQYYDVFDFDAFSKTEFVEQYNFVWKRAYEDLSISAKEIKNNKLLEAVEYAYNEGIKRKLNADYKTLVTSFIFNGQPIEAALWITFKEDKMISIFKLEKEGIVIFEKFIEQVESGNEFFLVMYKKMEFDGTNIIIKGHSDVDYLPLKIPIKLEKL